MAEKLERIEIKVPCYNRDKGENDNTELMRVVQYYDWAFNDLESFMKNYLAFTGAVFAGSGKLGRLGNSEQVGWVENMLKQLEPIFSVYCEVAYDKAKEGSRRLHSSKLEKCTSGQRHRS